MKVTHLRAADFKRQPWKNGGGFTTELASFPAADSRTVIATADSIAEIPAAESPAERFTWRLSVAEVAQSGPFSDFAGYDRTIMLLEGEGMELSFDSRTQATLDRLFEPFPFDGGWKTSCRLLNGPVRDLNLMVDRERASGTLVVRAGDGTLALRARWTAIYALTGSSQVDGHRLAPGELLIFEGGDATLDIASAATAKRAEIHIEEKPHGR
jgi:uncharacterized protein